MTDEQKWHLTYRVVPHPDGLTREQVMAAHTDDERFGAGRREYAEATFTEWMASRTAKPVMVDVQ